MVMKVPVSLEHHPSNTDDDIQFAEEVLKTFYARRGHEKVGIDDSELLMLACVHAQLAQANAIREQSRGAR